MIAMHGENRVTAYQANEFIPLGHGGPPYSVHGLEELHLAEVLCSVGIRLLNPDHRRSAWRSILCLHRALCRLLSQSDSSQLFARHPRPNTPTRTGPGQGKCRKCIGHAFSLMRILPANISAARNSSYSSSVNGRPGGLEQCRKLPGSRDQFL